MGVGGSFRLGASCNWILRRSVRNCTIRRVSSGRRGHLAGVLEQDKSHVRKGSGMLRCLITLEQVFGEKGNEEENGITSTTLNPSHVDVAALVVRSIVNWVWISPSPIWVSLSLRCRALLPPLLRLQEEVLSGLIQTP